MKPGRKPLTSDQEQGLCLKCHKNKQTPAPKSRLGYKRYTPLCSTCNKEKYGLDKKPYRKKKKPHCERCGFIPEHKCQLDVHHIDNNHFNNDERNLKTLCANCHRLIHLGA